MHIDTGHNFPETLEFRDDLVKDLKETLIVRLVEDTVIQKELRMWKENSLLEMLFNPLLYWMLLKNSNLMRVLAVLEETRKNHAPKKGCFPYVLKQENGTRLISALKCGMS